MKNAKLIAILVLAALVVIVALQNTEEVETRVLFATLTMSRALLIGVTVGSGALVGLAGGLWIARSRRTATE